jgi:hypothetical protein
MRGAYPIWLELRPTLHCSVFSFLGDLWGRLAYFHTRELIPSTWVSSHSPPLQSRISWSTITCYTRCLDHSWYPYVPPLCICWCTLSMWNGQYAYLYVLIGKYWTIQLSQTTPDIEEYIVNLLAALVHLRIFAFEFEDDCPLKDGLPFIAKAFDRAPHLEYFSMPYLDHNYKRVGGKLVICDQTEFPFLG